jgi:hypothetical protein
MDPDDYKKQLTDALVELAKVQEQLDAGVGAKVDAGASK